MHATSKKRVKLQLTLFVQHGHISAAETISHTSCDTQKRVEQKIPAFSKNNNDWPHSHLTLIPDNCTVQCLRFVNRKIFSQ